MFNRRYPSGRVGRAVGIIGVVRIRRRPATIVQYAEETTIVSRYALFFT